jgi:peptidoglycan hydrolase CwlO-like protein
MSLEDQLVLFLMYTWRIPTAQEKVQELEYDNRQLTEQVDTLLAELDSLKEQQKNQPAPVDNGVEVRRLACMRCSTGRSIQSLTKRLK